MKNSNHSSDLKYTLTRSMKSQLRHWYRERFVRRQQTTALMAATSCEQDRRAISIVALLDVDAVMIGSMDAEEWQFVQTCHTYLDGYSDGSLEA